MNIRFVFDDRRTRTLAIVNSTGEGNVTVRAMSDAGFDSAKGECNF